MKRNLAYSGLVFALLFLWVVAGALTQYFMGAVDSETLRFAFVFGFGVSAVIAAIFFASFRAIRNKFFGATSEETYTPSRKFAAVAGTLLTVCVAGSVAQSFPIGKERAEAARAEAKRKEDSAKALAERQEKEQQRLAAMTPEERAAEARRKEEAAVAPIIKEGEAMIKRWREREAWATAKLAGKNIKEPDSKPVLKQEWADVKAHLSSIKSTQPQYEKSQALLVAMAEEDKKAAVADAAFQAASWVDARKEFAKRLEQVFIEKRMNTDVSASGPKNTILRIKRALASKVSANDMSKSDILETAEKAGFKKVVFTDGYDFAWQWELHPKVE